MATILDGKALSLKIRNQLKDKVQTEYLDKNKAVPELAVILVGDDMASKVYVAGKVKACFEVGIKVNVINLDEKTKQKTLNHTIQVLNKDKAIGGILLQLPLPKHLNSSEALNLIAPEKDVDGLTNTNLGKLLVGDTTGRVPCTPLGIYTLLKEYNIDLAGKNAVVIGRSILVGKPMALLLTRHNVTVTLCHSYTKDIEKTTKKADIIVCAVGKKGFLKESMVKQGAVVVDVGINRNKAGHLCGDVDFNKVSRKASYITPVPGGVGPLTIAMLLQNLLKG